MYSSQLYSVFKGLLNAYVKNELACVIGPGIWNCAMLMKFVKSFFLLSSQHELLLNTQGNFENNNQKLKLYPAVMA